MILSLALFMLMPQPVEVPGVDLKPTAQPVSVATAIKPASLPAAISLSANDDSLPIAPSEVLNTDSSSMDAALATAPTVVSPALILAVQPVAPRKKTLKEEHPTALKIWKGLAVAQSSAATFDAWTTRRNIETGKFVETNSWLKPFAGNASLYAVMQVRPVLFDYVGHRMLRSNKKWVRNLWWVPQTAQTVTNIWCGAKNMSIY
jgi:hypothetical protein